MARRSTEESLQETLDRLAQQDQDLGSSIGSTGAVGGVTSASGAPAMAPTSSGRLRRRWSAPVVAVVTVMVVAAVAFAAARTVTVGSTAPPTPSSTSEHETPSSMPSATASSIIGAAAVSSSPVPGPVPSSSPSSKTTVRALPAARALRPADARARLAAAFGTFRPFTRSGSGAATIALPVSAAGVVVVTAKAAGTVDVMFRDPTGVRTDDSPDVVPAGTTVVPFNLFPHVVETTVDVTANAPWTIRVEPMSAAPVLGRTAHGSLSKVLVSYGGVRGWSIACPTGAWVTSVSTAHEVIEEDPTVYIDDLVLAARWAPQVLVLEAPGPWTVVAR